MTNSVVSILRATPGLDEYPLFSALMSHSNEVTNFDDRQYSSHAAPNVWIRLTRRLHRKALSEELNHQIVKYIRLTKPQKFIAFKASTISSDVLNEARNVGAETLCVFPDLDPFVYGESYVEVLSMFDQFYHTKPNLINFYKTKINANAKLIGPFFDPNAVNSIEVIDKKIGVCFVGHHSPRKEKILREFASLYCGNLTIVGDRWSSGMFTSASANVVVKSAIFGSAINEIYRRSICVVGLLMEATSNRTEGDEITSRSILVPAAGGVLLHQRTKASERLFGGCPELLFNSVSDLVAKVSAIESGQVRRMEIAKVQQKLALAAGTNSEEFIKRFLNK